MNKKVLKTIGAGIIFAAFLLCLFAPLASMAADAPAQTSGFTALTQLPQINAVSEASSLPTFFNSLYKICIGVAAVIAVLQIMWAGVQIMTNKGSVGSNEAAKSRIQNAILGLVLVLSPVIVFSIINPDILNLKLDVGGLKSDYQPIPTNTSDNSAAPSQDQTTISSDENAASNCLAAGGTPAPDSSGPNAVRCTLPAGNGKCPVFSTTNITNLVGSENETCCSNQKGCKLNKAPKHTYCSCSGT